MRMLIVEDDKVTSTLLSKLLQRYGECDVAFDGKSAIDKFTSELQQTNSLDNAPYDGIVLDISLPEVNGQEVLAQIRDLEQHQGVSPDNGVPVIIITSHTDVENVFSAHVSGCSAYINKPYERAEIKRQLMELGLVER